MNPKDSRAHALHLCLCSLRSESNYEACSLTECYLNTSELIYDGPTQRNTKPTLTRCVHTDLASGRGVYGPPRSPALSDGEGCGRWVFVDGALT